MEAYHVGLAMMGHNDDDDEEEDEEMPSSLTSPTAKRQREG